MHPWRRLVGHRPIVTRLVLAVAGAMTIVLLVAGAFVFWRVQYALDRQLDQDLKAYQEVVERAVAGGREPPGGTPGQSYQVYDLGGEVIAGNASRRLVGRPTILKAASGGPIRHDVGHILPSTDHPYLVVTIRVDTASGPVVVAAAISKRKHDEALRELLLQLAIADLATLTAASVVGYGTARAALKPVEKYRLAAEASDEALPLPVTAGKDDEIARLGHTFNALLERIRNANARERQFLSDASHELRSPLALMRTELEWALLGPRDPAEVRTAFESLRAQVERLIALANALLELEEVHASDGLHGLVHLDQLVHEVAGRYGAREETGRPVEISTADDLTVDGNRHWLELALDNLLSNAVRHGAGTIRVTATQEHGRTRLSVSDEGPGFPADFVGRAFDRFARADSSRTTPGTGLGLALVEAVAQAHGGTASITGAQVTLDLPAPPRPSPPSGDSSRHASSP